MPDDPDASVPAPDPDDRLALADWRRRVAALYAEVRSISTSDPGRAWEHWRTSREHLFRGHSQSPVPRDGRAAFVARHWPYDARYRFEVRVLPVPAATSPIGDEPLGMLALPSSGEEAFASERIGTVTVPFPAGERSLAVYWLSGYAGGLFLPFRDATNGRETYSAGRYLLDAAKGADLGGDDDRLVLDFNFAYHPSCAFDPRWACPLAPPENRLDIRVEAGERLA